MSLDYYFDYMASTPIDPLVSQVMQDYANNTLLQANPSAEHPAGQKAQSVMIETENTMKKLLHASNKDKLIFTSGATEATNLALRGAAYQYSRNGKHIISTQIEHQATLSTLNALEKDGFNITLLPVKKDGLIDLDILSKSIRQDTILLSIAQVNNEIGVIQDLEAINVICKKHGVLLHIDAAQSIGKAAINMQNTPVDLMSFSAHKCYGPKGIGALYVRSPLKLKPIMYGGHQQSSTRPGTIPLMLIIAMQKAWEIAIKQYDEEHDKTLKLYKLITENLDATIIIHGNTTKRTVHNIMISLPIHTNEKALSKLKDKYNLSSAAACSHNQQSHVLKAIGIEESLQKTALRISLGRWSTKKSCVELIDDINKLCNKDALVKR